jgi:acid phosphatase
VVTADQSASPLSTRPGAVSAVPHFDHIVVAVVENHSYGEVLGTGRSRFLDSLAATGAVLTESYAVTHPSEPNYLALFSGSTQGLSDDSCPHSYSGPNLASALTAAGKTFTGYSEGLPAAGFTGCESGAYVRKHNPWVDFPAVASDLNQPMTSFPSDFTRLPTVSFVIPNLDNDMHDGSVRQGDQWLQTHLGGYARWASTHNSMLIITADEDDRGHNNHIPTIAVGAHVKVGPSSVRVDHYDVLSTILESLNLQPFGQAAIAQPITTVWSS